VVSDVGESENNQVIYHKHINHIHLTRDLEIELRVGINRVTGDGHDWQCLKRTSMGQTSVNRPGFRAGLTENEVRAPWAKGSRIGTRPSLTKKIDFQ